MKLVMLRLSKTDFRLLCIIDESHPSRASPWESFGQDDRFLTEESLHHEPHILKPSHSLIKLTSYYKHMKYQLHCHYCNVIEYTKSLN